MTGFRRTNLLLLLIVPLLVAACMNQEEPTATPDLVPQTEETTPAVVATEGGGTATEPNATQAPTEIPPTPTPSEPLAALVNEKPIYLSDYENELARYQQAEEELGPSDTNYPQLVMDALVERALITQAAMEAGVTVTEAEVDASLADLQETSGSAENFAAWLQTNQWTEEDFREAITAELLTQKMIERITADVPLTAEQIHARYIRVDDPALAQSLLDQVNNGADFGDLARQNSLDALSAAGGGDLGFFSAGTLLVPELETAAFALQPGETSQVIPVTNFDGSPTYYLLQVIERDPQRPLEGNQRSVLLEQTLNAWIEGLRAQAEITIFVDTNV